MISYILVSITSKTSETKDFSAQHCLILMIKKRKKSLDSGGQSGALFADLSKAFDCMDHELLLAQLYG